MEASAVFQTGTRCSKLERRFSPSPQPAEVLNDVAVLLERNLQTTRTFLRKLGTRAWKASGPVWQGLDAEAVLEFLQSYQVDTEARSVSLPLLCDYIERQRELGELAHWAVAVKGRESRDTTLGEADWGVAGGRLFQVSRARLASDLNNIGVLTSPGDEEEGLSAEALAQARALAQAENLRANPAARRVRAKEEGLFLLYPISRFSGAQGLEEGGTRRPLFDDPDGAQARDVIGLAVSFPHSASAQRIAGQYTVGTVGWRAV